MRHLTHGLLRTNYFSKMTSNQTQTDCTVLLPISICNALGMTNRAKHPCLIGESLPAGRDYRSHQPCTSTRGFRDKTSTDAGVNSVFLSAFRGSTTERAASSMICISAEASVVCYYLKRERINTHACIGFKKNLIDQLS